MIDKNRCIGCRACSSLSESIYLSEDGEERRIEFPAEIDPEVLSRLVDACPTGAISLDTSGEANGVVLTFRMRRCSACGAYFATEEEIKHVKNLLSERLDVDRWLDICPSCRRERQQESHASRALLIRGKGSF